MVAPSIVPSAVAQLVHRALKPAHQRLFFCPLGKSSRAGPACAEPRIRSSVFMEIKLTTVRLLRYIEPLREYLYPLPQYKERRLKRFFRQHVMIISNNFTIYE